MSSKGTRIYSFRLPEELMIQVGKTIDLRNEWTRDEPWTTSDFLRVALAEKIAKMDRSRRRKIAGDTLPSIPGASEGDA